MSANPKTHCSPLCDFTLDQFSVSLHKSTNGAIDMTSRTNKALELAHMMIKQAKMLKSAGLLAEARGLARRALAFKSMGHNYDRMQYQPVRISSRRHR